MQNSNLLPSLRNRKALIAAIACTTLSLVLSGCGMGSAAPAGSGLGASSIGGLSGIVHGGRQTVTGATIYAFAAGESGYGSAATLLSTATEGAGVGTFAFSAGNSNAITCSSAPNGDTSDILYLVEVGGNPGLSGGGTAVANADAVMLAVLGQCATVVANNPSVVINEISTIAGMTALQQFYNSTQATYAPSGGTLAAGTAENFGTSPGNLTGLKFAAATAQNLNVLSAGTSFPTTNAAGTNYQVPNASSGTSVAGLQIEVEPEFTKTNLEANVLANCVNSDPGSSSTCSTLFGLLTGATISDTMQAAYYMATNPTSTVSGTSNINQILQNASSFAPFTPTIATTSANYPDDWSLAIRYATPTTSFVSCGATKVYPLEDPTMVAVDGNGMIWIENAFITTAATIGNSLFQMDPTGVPMQLTGLGSACTAIQGPKVIAIDQGNNVYVSNYGSTAAPGTTILEYPYCASPCSNTAASSSTFKTFNTFNSLTHPGILVFDGAGDLFFQNSVSSTGGNDLEEVTASTISSTAGGGSATATQLASAIGSNQTYFYEMAIDSHFNVYLNDKTSLLEFSNGSYGTVNTYTGSAITASVSLALDGSNDLFFANGTGFQEIPSSVSAPTSTITTTTYPAFSGTATTNGGATAIEHITLDGLGNIWGINNATPGGVYEVTQAGVPISPSAASAGVGYGASTGTVTARSYIASSYATIDQSGNVWVGASTGGAGGSVLTEIVGRAAPVITPIAANLPATAGSTSNLGTRP